MSESDSSVEDLYDVIVVGSGGGLVGAYAAAARGLKTLVIEKTEYVGGTTAYSGAGIWLPGNPAEARGGGESDQLNGRAYLDAVIGDDAPKYLREAYLQAGPNVIAELEENPLFGQFVWSGVPDYYAGVPGSDPVGHTIFPEPVDESELGGLADLVRRPVWTERWGVDAGTVLEGGRALVGRALHAFVKTGYGTVKTNTALVRLLVEDDAVVGVVAEQNGHESVFRVTKGVILAAGGFERNAALREKYQPVVHTDEWTMGCPGNTGSALEAGIAVGAATDLLEASWFVPGLQVPDNRPIFWTGTWTGIYVNDAGERFMNENIPYDRAGNTMVWLQATSDVSHIPAHWVFDQRQIDDNAWRLPVDPVVPGWFDVDKWVEAGVLKKADTLAELAGIIGVPAGALEKTVAQYNEYVVTGVDEQFHRGEAPWDRFLVTFAGAFAGYTAHEEGPNPCLAAIDRGPYYAASLVVSDLGTKGGLRTDASSRVLREDGTVIKGLYASGNTMAAMSGRVYPGAGVPVGSSMVFSYLAAVDLADQP